MVVSVVKEKWVSRNFTNHLQAMEPFTFTQAVSSYDSGCCGTFWVGACPDARVVYDVAIDCQLTLTSV